MIEKDEGTLRLATPKERIAKAEEIIGRLQCECNEKGVKIHRLTAQLDVYRDIVNDLIAALREGR